MVAWGALQVAEKLFPALMLPQWTLTFVAVLLLIGFPITAIITWAFEITPDTLHARFIKHAPALANAAAESKRDNRSAANLHAWLGSSRAIRRTLL